MGSFNDYDLRKQETRSIYALSALIPVTETSSCKVSTVLGSGAAYLWSEREDWGRREEAGRWGQVGKVGWGGRVGLRKLGHDGWCRRAGTGGLGRWAGACCRTLLAPRGLQLIKYVISDLCRLPLLVVPGPSPMPPLKLLTNQLCVLRSSLRSTAVGPHAKHRKAAPVRAKLRMRD